MSADLQSLVDQLCALEEVGLATVITSVLQARPEVAPAVVTFSIPDLTYPPSRALIERRASGVIKSFNTNTGFGFIDCPELKSVFGNDIFLHTSQIGNFTPGDAVSFAVCLSKDNKPQGFDLQYQGGGKGGKGKQMDGKGDDFTQMMKGKGWGFKGDSWGGKGDGWGGVKGPDAWVGCKGDFWAKGDCWGGKGDCWGGKGDCWGGGGKKGGGKKGNGAPEEELGQFTGTIKSFNGKNGYGFIACPDLQAQGCPNDVFLHHHEMLEGFEVGHEVIFTAYLNARGQPQGKDLQAADGSVEVGTKRQRVS